MKTNKIAIIVSVLTLAASSSLWASPQGKHAVDKAIHRHGGANVGNNIVQRHTILRQSGPPGKGHVWTRPFTR